MILTYFNIYLYLINSINNCITKDICKKDKTMDLLSSMKTSGYGVLPDDLSYRLFISKSDDLKRIGEPIPLNDWPNVENNRDIKSEYTVIEIFG